MAARPRFLVGVALGLAAPVLGLMLLFTGLEAAGRLKAPAFANRLSFDEKARYLRERPAGNVEILLVGSSTTLHGVDGAVLRDRLGVAGDVVNLGVQGLTLPQIRFKADTFVPHHRAVAQVIMISTTLEYGNCEDVSGRFFQAADVLDYVDGGSALFYQFRYLDLLGVLKRAWQLPRLRNSVADLEAVSFDAHGSVLLEVPRDRIGERVWEGDPLRLEPPCYDVLRGLAEDLRARGVMFTVVVAPLRPGYLAAQDPDGALLTRHLDRLRTALDGTGAILIDAHGALDLPEEAFFDAYHVNRGVAPMLTRLVSEQLHAAAEQRTASLAPARALEKADECRVRGGASTAGPSSSDPCPPRGAEGGVRSSVATSPDS